MLNWIFPRGARDEQRIYPSRRYPVPIVARREDGTLSEADRSSRLGITFAIIPRCALRASTRHCDTNYGPNGTAWRRRNVAKELQVYLVGRDDSTKRVTVLRPN